MNSNGRASRVRCAAGDVVVDPASLEEDLSQKRFELLAVEVLVALGGRWSSLSRRSATAAWGR